MWSTGKPTFHTNISTIHIEIVVEEIQSQMTKLGYVIAHAMFILIPVGWGIVLLKVP